MELEEIAEGASAAEPPLEACALDPSETGDPAPAWVDAYEF